MKSKEEILNSYNTTGNDGLPEISAPDLLKAMETYKELWAKAAFNAARQTKEGVNEFATYTDYAAHALQEVQQQQQNRDEFAEAITLAANSVLPHFIPHDRSAQDFSFNFTMQGKSYAAFYKKDTEGYWHLDNWTTAI
jgi:methionine aminopeptidase